MTRSTEERREYYRIEDSLALEILPTDASEPAHAKTFALLNELHHLDVEAQPLLRQLADRDRVLAHYLKLQSKRIELLGQALGRELLEDFGEPQQVTLSEGGVSFEHPSPFEPGARVSLRLLMLPEAVGLQLEALILHCIARDDGRYEIAVEFIEPGEIQRQLLARHILQKQAAERRQAREQEKGD